MSDELANLKARYERLNLLYQVSNVIHSTLEPHKALQLIVDEAVQLMHASSGSVALLNPTSGFLDIEAAHGLPLAASKLRLRLGQGVTGWVARAGKPARVGDVSKDPRYVMVRRNVRSELAVPLEVNGVVRGVLNVDSDRLNAFTAENQELLQDLGAQAAKVIHNTWLYEQLRLKALLFESLVSVGQAINSTLNLDDALKVITRGRASCWPAKCAPCCCWTTPANGSTSAPVTAPAQPTSTNRGSAPPKACSASSCGAKSRCRWKTFRPPAVINTWTSPAGEDWSRC